MLLDYFDDVYNGLMYILAAFSIIGLLGVIISIIYLITRRSRINNKIIGLLILSIILLCIGGLRGISYFGLIK